MAILKCSIVPEIQQHEMFKVRYTCFRETPDIRSAGSSGNLFGNIGSDTGFDYILIRYLRKAEYVGSRFE